MLNNKATWVLIFDGTRCQVFALWGLPIRLQVMPGASFHGLQARHAEETFVADIAKWIISRAEAGTFDQLIAVAPPRAMSVLRDNLPSFVKDHRVLLEISADWNKLPLEKISDYLHDHLIEAGVLHENANRAPVVANVQRTTSHLRRSAS